MVKMQRYTSIYSIINESTPTGIKWNEIENFNSYKVLEGLGFTIDINRLRFRAELSGVKYSCIRCNISYHDMIIKPNSLIDEKKPYNILDYHCYLDGEIYFKMNTMSIFEKELVREAFKKDPWKISDIDDALKAIVNHIPNNINKLEKLGARFNKSIDDTIDSYRIDFDINDQINNLW